MEKDLKLRSEKKSQQIVKTIKQTKIDPEQQEICQSTHESLRSVLKQLTSTARGLLKIAFLLLTLAEMFKPVQPVYITTSTD